MGSKKAAAILLVVIVVFAATVFLFSNGGFLASPPPVQIYEPTIPLSDQKVVCLVFDDGWKSHVQTAAILESYNFTGTFTIITSYVGYPAYMSWQDIASLAQKGNDIVSHTDTHANLSAVDEVTLNAELSNSRNILRSKGYAADVFVYPYGEATDNWTVRNTVANYYLLAGGTEAGQCDLNSFDRYNVNSFGIYPNTTQAEFASNLNGTQGSTLTVLYYYKISDENTDSAVTSGSFQMQMQYLKDNNFTVRTVSQEFLKKT